jgi:transposase-like protein
MLRNKRSRQEWFSLIERCESSEITVKEFCKTHGIHPSNYYYWMKRFRSQEPDFAPLEISSKALVIDSPVYELVYPNGVMLRLGQGVGLGELSQLLRLY